MGTGYTRADVANNIADGNIVNASDLDNEYDAIEAAFNSSTGHTHDGTSAEGGPITVVGPVQDLVVSATEVKPKTTNTLDLGTSALLYKDAYLQGNMYFRDTALKIVSSADGQLDIDADVEVEITAPTLDIDASTAVTIDTATLTITGSANITGDLDVDNININGNTIISTDTNGNIALTPNGTGEVDISKVDIDSGAIDGTVIGANSAAAITGTTITGTSFVTSGDMTFGDNDKAIFGAGSDLQIYHDSNNSYITEGGDQTGDLFIRASNLKLTNASGDFFLWGRNADSVRLYHNNAQKLETTSGGIDVTGTVTADGLTVDNSVSTFNGTTVNIDLMESDTTDANTRIRQSASGLSIQTVNDAATAATNRMRIDHTTGDISFRADDGTTDALYFDASTQRLGLGTTSPATALHINEDSANQIRLQRSGYDTIDIALSENGLRFRNETDGRNDLFLDGAGNVGIGTSSPDTKFHVQTNVSDTNAIVENTTHNVRLQLLASGADKNSEIWFGDGGDDDVGRIDYDHANDSMAFYTNASEAARIDSSGRVLIGDSNPDSTTEKLVVSGNGNNRPVRFMYDGSAGTYFDIDTNAANGSVVLRADARSGAYPPMVFQTSATERLRIDSSGNVGIGTTDTLSNSKLNVERGVVARNDGAVNPYFQSYNDNAGTDLKTWRLGGSTSGDLIFQTVNDAYTVASTKMSIDSSGNLGIGVSDPSQDIDLVGSSNAGSGSVRAGGTGSGTQAAFIAQAQFGSAAFGTYSSYPAILDSSNNPVVYFDTNNGGRAVFDEGVTFNGDTAAANALDDYEEGTFTPAINFGGNAVGVTYNMQEGYYTKIGRKVTANIILRLSSKGSSSGTINITGLPFSVMSGPDFTSGSTSNFANFSGLNSPPLPGAGEGGTTINLRHLDNSGGSGTSDPALADSNVGNTLILGITITYFN